ncbi:carbohydrate ABC transporter permease [Xylophilus ampelinus]|uniref:Carbohydrate ABC transporter membrane protein 1 (CUT1 family) n=1 Tax=Xylophilus ampelinus TaxID=54067 RepID=A0A318SQ48_9BURK|nr:sugar ABC transporter permease [Xylophilus ampelinus]MCS4509410.1 sugar ABC transporter permease [Xylophilus ampelinus]PYE79132.1 carbohydrate ABC transporter membrane protein 1 (CUT1 family) [Xylophilus ampelinus]
MKTPAWVPLVYVGPAAVVMAAACLYPVLSALQLGFYDWSIGTPWSDARWVGLETFLRTLQDPAVWRSLRITLLFAFVCVTAEMVLGIALALALEDRPGRPLRGVALFRMLFILPMMIAPIAVGLTWRYLFDAQFGLVNALLGVFGAQPVAWLANEHMAFAAIVIADIWQWTPFVFIMMIAALANVDTAVLEAARMDGANWWQTTFRVKLPMVMNVIVVTLLMRLIDAFRVLEVVYILTFGGPGDSTEILSLHIYKTAFVGQQLGAAAAVSVLLLAVVAGLSWFALRLSDPLHEERP